MKNKVSRNCSLCDLQSSHLHLEENFSEKDFNNFSFSSRKEPEPFHMRLFLCEACDLIYANPALSQEFIAKEYESAAFDSKVEAGYAAKTYARYLSQKSIIKSALDIGTGGGEFLLELQKNGVEDLHGIEPSIQAIKTAQEGVKNFIKQGVFDKDLYGEKKFELISCFQTLEHVADPLKLSKDAYSLLKKEGRFFVVTHNFRGAVNKILGNKSPIYDIEHLQLFSPKSLRYTLELAGFKNIKIFPLLNTYPLFYWIKLLPAIPAKKQILSLVKKIKIGYLPIALPVGNIGAIATK